MSQVRRFTQKILIRHRGAKASWRKNMWSVKEGHPASVMDAVPSGSWGSAVEQARLRLVSERSV